MKYLRDTPSESVFGASFRSGLPQRFVLLCLAAVLLVGCGRETTDSPRAAETIAEQPVEAADEAARLAMQRGDWAAAQARIQEALLVRPNDPVVLELAGDIAAASRRFSEAVELYQSAVENTPKPTLALLDKVGKGWMNLGRPFEAVRTLESAVQLYPNQPAVRTDLAGLLAALGMQHQAGPHLQWLAMRGHAGVSELIMLSDLARPQNNVAMSEYSLKHYPADLRPQFSLSIADAYKDDWSKVRERLRPVVAKYPEFTIAHAYYGRAIVELDDDEAVQTWAASLPEGIEDEPQYWMAAGIWAERQGDVKQAARGYWEAAMREDDNAEALSRLGIVLAELQRDADSRAISERAGQLAQMRDAVDLLHSRQDNSQQVAVRIAKAMQELGRPWEAAGWLRAGAMMDQAIDPSLRQVYASVRATLTAKTPWQLPESKIAKELDLSHFPAVSWASGKRNSIAKASPSGSGGRGIRFEDQAASRNLNHVCAVQTPDRGEAGLWIYQSGAGGAAAIDFDLDGWGDVYLTAMDGTPQQDNSSPNRCFRNLAGQFLDVTPQAALGDAGFAQGLAVGDVNSDGFDDIYVANYGRNRLYQNNGDGTFTDVTDASGLRGNDWTTSVAIADINQDGYADLFDVGYCNGRDPFEVPCKEEGKIMACLPKSFPAQSDRVWQGQPEGRFVEVTDTWLEKHDSAHGLGIVVGQFDEIPGLDVYVANDMAANHFWSAATDRDGAFALSEQAVVRGLAVDRRSLSQASMGIAVGDPDRDGDFDFYLTHFAAEYNTYYEQIRPGMWADLTSRVGLAEPTMPLLAFGTQWFDADNDGSLELMVANGHLNDFRYKGDAYRMPMQLFHRQSDGKWSLLDPDQLGEYFRTKRLARSLIHLDVDRDGRQDALVTHLFDPVSLLVNQSVATSSSAELGSSRSPRSIAFYLKGTEGHRDAIGAIVSVEIAGKPYVGQLFAGNGYQCSSERCVRFGLAEAAGAEQISVQWPSGKREMFGSLNRGGEFLLREGSGQAFPLPRR
ncbi:FG-GAP-like repeat-containing protein [Novipirellula sp.]|uniref:FG-GAP-like repeat-containing protein n=1 Tax=Novipirellula sp. TaxID=2795430 RepID=UPI00356429DE